MNIKAENSIYVRTLLYAYKKQHLGFTKEELKNDLALTDQEFPWIDWMFTNGLNGAAPLVWSMSGDDYGKKFYLTSDGIAAAVDYLELKEAQEGGKRATMIALVSIIVSVVVGIIQIYISLSQDGDVNKLTDSYSEIYQIKHDRFLR